MSLLLPIHSMKIILNITSSYNTNAVRIRQPIDFEIICFNIIKTIQVWPSSLLTDKADQMKMRHLRNANIVNVDSLICKNCAVRLLTDHLIDWWAIQVNELKVIAGNVPPKLNFNPRRSTEMLVWSRVCP